MAVAPSRTAADLLKARVEPELVDVPEFLCAMVDGRGAPEGTAFAEALEALYSISYGARFALKRQGVEFKVMPLEGLWGSSPADLAKPRADWLWTAMIVQPPEVTPALFEELREKALARHPTSALREIRLEAFREGLAAQLLHVGPYSAEAPSIARLHAFIAAQGLRPRGRHHEVYLGDPRRAAPAKLRTILRQPAG